MTRHEGQVETEALIIGAGPAGLFAAFQLGMTGVRAHVVDVLPHAGGQCVELYPQKPIYDIPAHPRITGRELAERLLEQAAPFDPVFHFGEAARELERLEDGGFRIRMASGLTFTARVVVLLHRRPEFRAAPESVRRMEEMAEAGELDFRLGQIRGLSGDGGRLRAVRAAHGGEEFELPADVLLLFFGLSGRLGPIAQWGLDMEAGRIRVDTEAFETNVPGVFAIGDVCVYPGKLKLILSGFHEAALMAQKAVRYVRPDEHHAFVHSTSSEILAERLGRK